MKLFMKYINKYKLNFINKKNKILLLKILILFYMVKFLIENTKN